MGDTTVVAFAPDGKVFASGAKGVKLWDSATRQELRTLGNGRTTGLSFSGDGKLLLATEYLSQMVLWEPATGRKVREFKVAGLSSAALSPDGRYALSGDRKGWMRLWDCGTGAELKKVKADEGPTFPPLAEIRSVAFSPDGPRAMSGGWDKVAKLWELPDCTQVRTFPGHKGIGGVNSVKFSADGAFAVTADCGGGVYDAIHELRAAYRSAAKPTLRALVIGIDEYQNPKLRLQFAAADALLFADTIRMSATPLFGDLNVKTLVTRADTTRDNLVKELKGLQAMNPDDLFVLYVASHGTVEEGEYFLITSNVGSTRTERLRTDAIGQSLFRELVGNIPATKKLIIIYTCNAGALGEVMQSAPLTRGMSEDTAMKILGRAVGSTILSASTSVQEALEGYLGHGLFTYVLTEGLRGKADSGRTGYVKTTELADYVDAEVPALADRVFKKAQYPTISISGQGFPIGKVED